MEGLGKAPQSLHSPPQGQLEVLGRTMIKPFLLTVFGAAIAVLLMLGAAEAGTCQPVSAKGRAADAATATTKAQAKLVERAARKGGKLMNTSTSCKKGVLGFECTMTGASCP